MIRRFGEAPRKDQTYRLRPGAYALLPRDGQLLLTCQYGPAPESPIPALHREVYEETGWKIATPKRIGAFRRFVYMPEYDLWAEKICHIYTARPVLQLSEPVEKDHVALWMPIADASEVLGNAGDQYFAALLARLG